MKSRILVAVFGVPVVLGCVYNTWLFTLLITIAAVMAVSELYRLLSAQRPYAIVGLAAAAVTPLLTQQVAEAGLIASILVSLPLTLLVAGKVRRVEPVAAIAATLLPVFYVVLPAAILVLMRESVHGVALILLLLAGTWLSDTGAFFGGKLLGRHKLAPRISPGKTVEGLICGVVIGTFAVWYGGFIVSGSWPSGIEALILGVAISLATPVGDLFESLLKRSAQVKDSGRLLGEHGGMLDRIDALLLAAPTLYVAAALTGGLDL